MVVSAVVSANGVSLKGTRVNGRTVKLLTKFLPSFIRATFGTPEFDIPTVAIALLIVGVVVGLSGLILSIFATATASAVNNPEPGTLAYNLTHPVIQGMVSFYGFYPTLYVLLAVAGIVLISAGIIYIIMSKFRTNT